MHLAYKQGKRFYRILDALTLFANETLQVTDDLFDPLTHKMQPAERNEVMKKIGDNPEIIDAFVSMNPCDLDLEDLLVARSWKMAIHGTFFIAEHGNECSVFLGAHDAFAVKGLAQDIDELVPETPALVSTTLLPFEDSVVFAAVILSSPANFGSGILNMIEEDLARFRKKGLVSTADQFVQAYQTHMQESGRREIEHLLEELEDATGERPEKELPAGFHRGCLAGLNALEREAALDDFFEFDFEEIAESFLEERTMQGAPTRIFADALGRLTKEDLLDIDLGGDRSKLSHLEKSELIACAVETLPHSLDVLTNALETCPDVEYTALRALFEAGGYRVAPTAETLEDIRSLAPFEPYSFLFAHEESLVLVLPDELLPLFQLVDWVAIESARQLTRWVIECAETYVELCGAIPIGEVYEQFCAWHPGAAPEEEFLLRLIIAHVVFEANFEFWDEDGTDSLLHCQLAADLESEDEKIQCSARTLLGLLLNERTHMPLRECDEELREMGFYRWLHARPQIHALQRFLDAHIPDGEDDLTFTDGVVDILIEMRMFGCSQEDTIEFLDNRGLLADDGITNELLQIFNVAINSVPLWKNNGFSALDMLEQDTGKKLFFNPDGGLRKVGRNDPCPCGSGKKYKKCCG